MMPQYRRPYTWLQVLMIVMTVVAVAIGVIALHYIETRLVAAAGESLSVAAAEIADKLDRLLFERYGDVRMMARAFGSHMSNAAYLNAYLAWMKQSYSPVYLWLGVTDRRGRVVVATDPGTVGQDMSTSAWFRSVRDTRTVHVGDVEPYEAAGGVDAVALTAPIAGPRGEFLGVVTTRVGLPVLEEIVTKTVHDVQATGTFLGTMEYQFMTRTGEVFIDSDLIHKGNVNLVRLGLPSARIGASAPPGYLEEEHKRRLVPVVTGYARTQGFGEFPGLEWRVLVRMDRSDILMPIRDVVWKLGLAGAIMWGPMFVLLFWATGRLRKEYAQAQEESAHAKAAEATLRESEEQTRAIVDTALDAVIGMNEHGQISGWSHQAEAIFGWPRLEAIGRSLATTIIPSRYREAHERGLRHFLATGQGPLMNQRIEITACHRDGHEFPVELSVAPVLLGNTWVFSAFVRDITQRKSAERRLAAQYAVTRVLAESLTLQEASTKILEAICESLEWELGIFWNVDQPANVLRCIEVWHVPGIQVAEFVTVSRERTFLSGIGLPGRVWANGQPAWIPDVVNDTNFPRAPIAAKVGLHGAFGFPVRIGKNIYGVIEFFSHDIREPDRDLLDMITDIGLKVGQFIERKRAEGALQQAQEQLQQAQKMEAVGRLAGGVAHDFNNLLTIISGSCHFILGLLGSQGRADPLRKEVEEIKHAGSRAATLTSQLLAFSRRQVLTLKELNLNEVIRAVEGMLQRLIGEDINLVTVLDPALGTVRADPGQVEQIMMNLVANARDAMPSGGRLTLETANVELGEAYAHQHAITQPGSYVMLAVSDTGWGMDKETQAHIFEPFFTTKALGRGTGLGLAMVYGSVRQNGGSIFVYSEPGRGTTFKIYLPRVQMQAETARMPPSLPAELPRGSETVLVVEDEPGVRAVILRTLQEQGYTVLEARHGIEALQIGMQPSVNIHLLLTDVVMPQVNGREVAERLTLIHPEIRVLYISGYTDDAVVRHGILAEGAVFLQKPFTPDTLAHKVREVLDMPRGNVPSSL